MRMRILGLVLLLAATPARAHEDPDGHAFQLDYLAGRYVLVAKALDGDETSLGALGLARSGRKLSGHRTVGAARMPVSGIVEHPTCCEGTHVLRLRFQQDGQEREATYLWQGDLDNYARISGYVYEPGKRTDWPGMEVLFRDHRQPATPPERDGTE